jgi:signal transduction histidine kinase
VRFEIPEPLREHPIISRLTYRAVREALGNAVKHSGASSIVVRIEQVDDVMVFEVQDDGSGFDPALASPEGHLGRRLTAEMVSDAGGVLVTESSAENGTLVRGELPL